MNRIVFFILLGSLLTSCGSRRKVKASPTPPKEVVVKPSKNTPNFNNALEYISYFKQTAVEEMQLFNIPASITLAQGILESGSGKGRLARVANNHFGIKCHDWTGDKIYHDDDERQECFRKYISAETSFRDHSEFLVNRKRYAKLFELKKSDYKNWAKELRKAGYATDRKYPEKLIGLIDRYELHQYDKMVLGNDYEIIVDAEPEVDIEHTVAKGDTLYSISRKYGLSVSELQKLNNLKDNTISIGQTLKVKSN